MRLGWIVTTAGAAALIAGCGNYAGTLAAKPTKAFPITWEGKTTKAYKQKQAKKKAKDAAVAADEQAYAAAQQSGTLKGWLAYLKDQPAGSHREEAVKEALAIARRTKDVRARGKAMDRVVAIAPEVLLAMAASEAVLYVGPEGRRVKDVIAMLGDGLGEEVIAAQIAKSEDPYKDFTLEELSALKKLGVPDPVTKAMIESHAAALKTKRAQSERDALKAEIASLRALVEKQGQGGGKANEGKGGGKKIKTKDGPMDVVACRAARLGALKLCEQIPWPGSTVCKSSAESGFPCP